MKSKVILFDENENSLNNLVASLNTDPTIQIAGSYTSWEKLVEILRSTPAEILIIEPIIKDMNGLDMVRQLKIIMPHIYILIMTTDESTRNIIEAIRAGVSGYLLKSSAGVLNEAVAQIRVGGTPIHPLVAKKVFDVVSRSPLTLRKEDSYIYHLTRKEKQILVFLVNGQSYKMICAEMAITYDTLRTHIKKIYQKLGVNSLTEVVAKAIYQQLV